MDYVREDPCEVCERVRRGPDERAVSASQYNDVRMRCACPGHTGSARECRNVSGECRTTSYSSRRIGEYLRSGGASPTSPRDLDTDCPQSVVMGSCDDERSPHVFGNSQMLRKSTKCPNPRPSTLCYSTNIPNLFAHMAPVDWNALAPRKASPAKTKEDELLVRWAGVTEHLTTEAMCRPDDKEGLEDDMRSWVRCWDEISVSTSDPSRSMLIFVGGSRGIAGRGEGLGDY
jgi:hypothetical protein